MAPVITAASSTQTSPATLFLLIVLAAAGYLIHCVIWPYRACHKCGGTGRFLAPSGKAWRYCNRCGGKGAQLRTGRRIWTYLKNTHDRDRRNRR